MIQSYPWYIADWRESETRRRLTPLQRGLYRELLDYCFLEGSLPDDRQILFSIAGVNMGTEADLTLDMSRSQSDHALKSARTRLGHSLSTVLSLFVHNEITHRYTHPKVDEILPKLFSYHEQKRHAGAKSGKARRERALNGRSEQKPEIDEPSPAPAPAPAPSASIPPRSEAVPPPTFGEFQAKLQTAAASKGLNGNRKPAPPAAVVEAVRIHEWTREVLMEYPGARELPGRPDDGIIKGCLLAVGGDPEMLSKCLRAMHLANKAPKTSWAWFTQVLPQYAGAERRSA